MQDEIVSRLANALNAQLVAAEARRAEGVLHPDAMDLYFQGMAWLNRGSNPETNSQARTFFERSLALDPQNIEALVGSAIVGIHCVIGSFTGNHIEPLRAAETAVTKALSLAPNHALAHNTLGYLYLFTNRVAQGIAECERALELDGNLADAHALVSVGKYFIGRGAETEAHVQEAFRRSPRPFRIHPGCCSSFRLRSGVPLYD
jgi:tetratricopeptide (TPR) repeat protein